MQTIVLFRKDKSGDNKGQLTAVFPTDIETVSGNVGCYAHIGQHSTCSMQWVYMATIPATKFEYQPLLDELKSMGYEDLFIAK